MNHAFTPQDEGTIPILVGVASAVVSLSTALGDQFELYNSGTVPVFIRWGASNAAATTGTASATAPTKGSYPVAPGAILLVTRPPGATHLAHISGTAAQTLYVTPGNGS
jgi:hypothetical protein